jgi:enoyl-CoA hydratase/carnithine racemase
MDEKTVLVERREGGVVVVTLNRPAVLNAMNRVLRRELNAAFDEIHNARDVRAVVITAAGAGRQPRSVLGGPGSVPRSR